MRRDAQQEFSRYLRDIVGPHFLRSKHLQVILRNWEVIRELVADPDLTHITIPPPSYVEIHPDDHCQNDCVYCRGGPREIPTQQTRISTDHILRIIADAHERNPLAFVRLSGTIGEPLLHPGIVRVFDALNDPQMRWGLTTNGLSFPSSAMEALMRAEWIQISLDAGSNDTYIALKKSPSFRPPPNEPLPFDQVLTNVHRLVALRNAKGSKVGIFVSFLVQTANYEELPSLSRELKRIGIDGLQIKVQHFDANRRMPTATIDDFFLRVLPVTQRDQVPGYSIMVLQTRDEAHHKNSGLIQLNAGSQRASVPSHTCYTGLLGNLAVGRGKLWPCCQYFGRTLGAIGDITSDGLENWNTPAHHAVFRQDAIARCDDCSPSDQLLNAFVDLIVETGRDENDFLCWAEQELLKAAGRLNQE